MELVVAFMVAATSTCGVPSAEGVAQRSLPYAEFDSRGAPFGWRALAATGCTDAAISLLDEYAKANRSRLSAAESGEVAFHIGQALAMAGREQESIAPFERALHPGASAEWSIYVNATLAFLRRDVVALKAARASYETIAPGSVRLRIIEGLVACPAEPYIKAAHCSM